VPADSLIPMFEGMVERALSRTHLEAAPGPPQSAVEVRAAAAATGFGAIVRATTKGS